MYFPYYGLSKMWLDNCIKSPVSKNFSTVNLLKCPKDLGNMHHSTFIILSHYSQEYRGRKMSLLVISEILGLFVNTLAADDKYSLRKSENLPQPI